MTTVAVIGASRGIGLELARQYAADGCRVHATTRALDAPGALGAVGGDVHLHPLDVVDDGQIEALAGALSEEPIDILIHNAGINAGRGAGDPETTARSMRINAEAPIVTVAALLDSVVAGGDRKVAVMSSVQGSGRSRAGSPDLYGDSKRELNTRFRAIEPEWRARGITAVALHPGYVRTDMTGSHASLSPEESVRGIRNVLAGLTAKDSGRFLDYRGKDVAW
ncbi:MAG: SDR family NAD(P)-dependent oxidoreductase [Rhodospirillaceae bacterium]|jgi:NAD(P)-dependent dehydrogenase (short-subunit alcohol dehydrogenase family)|nr:SDR family NAD(P)-dependent oxidoreductase [Rhodospirillaceae bacterium]MBT5944643.1 SDR family NAD(P)-dependent oxidoreductase [Rhodospirillaceae bacterium]MBT6404660.1 SDR family NAD(P)-dependent oxidoreductase [Rhodospirillaceae bacterium]MBT6535591.1 SDR family NAD(P)-dependent oxidoreductase [Rhodospirillaceae bacterium]MBT7362985.1 SDR family NAD(P)-dependent oxidoreductase [Rhodospirillaceae bacterium]